MEYRELGKTGLKLSSISFGASSLGSVFREVSVDACIRTVHASLDNGINFIDVSPYYGLTLAETNLGLALKEIDRERYILATKVGRYGQAEFDFSADRVTRSIDESLARMNVEHI
ncbi:MAG: aldo/keto reductase, partial [Lentisphaeria bacterium]|nr:aldo/keto reductase [Lentisphaeria bacterium]NQZ69552.1 aldo/keto reductase [Lentisphaeria bacterium]